MPEGHILHRLAGELTGEFAGRRVTSWSPQGRFTDAERFTGARLDRAWARGKHLFVGFAGHDEQVHVHLGLYGAMTITPEPSPAVVGQVRWRLGSTDHTMDLRGPSRCEVVDPLRLEQVLARLGPDPLDPAADPTPMRARILRSGKPIAALLLDQAVLAGVGNVYRAEVLFRLGIDPWTPGRDLDETRIDAIWADVVEQMAHGVERGRIDTVRPDHEPEAMGRPPRQDDHGGEVYVYRRSGQACLVCAEEIQTALLEGRNLFWCRRCQAAN